VTLASTAAWVQPFFHNDRKAASWLGFIALLRVSFLTELTSRVPTGTSTGMRFIAIVFTEGRLQMMASKENRRRTSVLQSLQILALLVFVLTSLQYKLPVKLIMEDCGVPSSHLQWSCFSSSAVLA